MRLPTRPSAPAQASLTPLIDVVFLLIIFFLVSSHLARRENHLPVQLPLASTAPTPDLEATPLVITVSADQTISVAGRKADLESLHDILVDWSGRSDASKAIRIRADASVPYSSVEPILRSAAKAGLSDASIAVIQSDAYGPQSSTSGEGR
jgi:biopolymer transport protein ExbD